MGLFGIQLLFVADTEIVCSMKFVNVKLIILENFVERGIVQISTSAMDTEIVLVSMIVRVKVYMKNPTVRYLYVIIFPILMMQYVVHMEHVYTKLDMSVLVIVNLIILENGVVCGTVQSSVSVMVMEFVSITTIVYVTEKEYMKTLPVR